MSISEELDYQYSCSKWSKKSLPAEKVVDDFVQISLKESEIVKENVSHKSDVRYGDGERQLYDLYGTDLPPESGIVVFIHGGYWQALTKDSAAVVVNPLYKQGLKVIIADYDLAPKVTLGRIIEQIHELCTHVLELALKIGAVSVWIMGHSAGAHLTSTLLDPVYQQTLSEEMRNILRGMILISGVYDVAPLVKTTINDALGITSSDAPRLSTQTFFSGRHGCKILFVHGKHESPEFHRQTAEAYEASTKNENYAEILIAQNDDHFTIIENLKYPSFEVTVRIVSFINNFKI